MGIFILGLGMSAWEKTTCTQSRSEQSSQQATSTQTPSSESPCTAAHPDPDLSGFALSPDILCMCPVRGENGCTQTFCKAIFKIFTFFIPLVLLPRIYPKEVLKLHSKV
jgi:hypothetical protein